ncbi:MAG: carbohydrate-binding protein, partial [Planctomycetes bacterium]|nr:carbohydrate-binding protein [Planctomycetota bacterium]
MPPAKTFYSDAAAEPSTLAATFRTLPGGTPMRLHHPGLFLSLLLLGEGLAGEPFRGGPRQIPGVIEAEDFDAGDAGVAYHDLTEANHGADYRGPTQVDIERRADASNGHGIGWARAGEWLTYTVEAADAGPYTLEISVASAKAGGRFHIEFDGKDATGPIQVPNTGGWTKLQALRGFPWLESVDGRTGSGMGKCMADGVISGAETHCIHPQR